VEELLRYEPPVQMLAQRTALTDVEVAGVTITKGAPLILVLASGSRDPKRFHDPDHSDPTRRDNQHFGFCSGVHICLARRSPASRRRSRCRAHPPLGGPTPHSGPAPVPTQLCPARPSPPAPRNRWDQGPNSFVKMDAKPVDASGCQSGWQ